MAAFRAGHTTVNPAEKGKGKGKQGNRYDNNNYNNSYSNNYYSNNGGKGPWGKGGAKGKGSGQLNWLDAPAAQQSNR